MHHVVLLAASPGVPPAVTASAQALIPAMIAALALIVAAAVTVLAIFIQSNAGSPLARGLCALGIVYLLVASFSSLRDSIYALTTHPPQTLASLREIAWTILFPAIGSLVVLGAIACIMLLGFVDRWARERVGEHKKFMLRTFLIFAVAFVPIALIGTFLSPDRTILLPSSLIRMLILAAIVGLWAAVIVRVRASHGAEPSAGDASGAEPNRMASGGAVDAGADPDVALAGLGPATIIVAEREEA
jgi:hypothetical protein